MAQLTTDKYEHYIGGTVIACILLTAFNMLGWNIFLGYGIYIVGITLFEVYQRVFKKGQFDLYDIVAGALGGAIILITLLTTQG